MNLDVCTKIGGGSVEPVGFGMVKIYRESSGKGHYCIDGIHPSVQIPDPTCIKRQPILEDIVLNGIASTTLIRLTHEEVENGEV